MSPNSTMSTKVRLANGDIVEVPHISPSALLVAMDESPDKELDIIKEGIPATIKLTEIVLVCVEFRSTNFGLMPAHVMHTVNDMKASSKNSKQIRQERTMLGLYSVPPLPPLSGGRSKTF